MDHLSDLDHRPRTERAAYLFDLIGGGLRVPLTIRKTRSAPHRRASAAISAAAGRPNATASIFPNATRPDCGMTRPPLVVCHHITKSRKDGMTPESILGYVQALRMPVQDRKWVATDGLKPPLGAAGHHRRESDYSERTASWRRQGHTPACAIQPEGTNSSSAWLGVNAGLRDEQWERVAPLLPGKVGDPGRSGEDNRRFLEAVL
jgi:hypothetical protein